MALSPRKNCDHMLRGITSNHHGDFYCLNCFDSYRTLNKLKKHEEVCNNHDYYRVGTPKEHGKIKYLPAKKSLKVPFIIYANIECLLKKCNLLKIILKILRPRKKVKRKPSGYAWCSICSFDDTKNRRYFYRRKDCIEKFRRDLKELGTEIIDFEEKEMILLTNKEIKSYEKPKVCLICKETFCNDKNKKKVKDHCHYNGKFRGAAHSECNLRYKAPKEIPVVFHNGSPYDYHFIIKKLVEEFEGEFECLGENAEKHITFSVPL